MSLLHNFADFSRNLFKNGKNFEHFPQAIQIVPPHFKMMLRTGVIEQVIDIHARNYRVPAEYEGHTFCGQLQHMSVLDLLARSSTPAKTLVSGIIQSCVIERHDNDL
ncbi:hypothetical protein BD309DRAFT_1024453 [Dichomitus squalens]|nr:hypothetical protein BD309DRAFT_1024453 [Dichomitus squalens]